MRRIEYVCNSILQYRGKFWEDTGSMTVFFPTTVRTDKLLNSAEHKSIGGSRVAGQIAELNSHVYTTV